MRERKGKRRWGRWQNELFSGLLGMDAEDARGHGGIRGADGLSRFPGGTKGISPLRTWGLGPPLPSSSSPPPLPCVVCRVSHFIPSPRGNSRPSQLLHPQRLGTRGPRLFPLLQKTAHSLSHGGTRKRKNNMEGRRRRKKRKRKNNMDEDEEEDNREGRR